MLEAYRAYGDQFTMAELTQRLVQSAAVAVGRLQIETDRGTVDLSGDWQWLTFYDSLSHVCGESVDISTPRERWVELAGRHAVELHPEWDAQKIALELFGDLVEPTLLQPTFVCDFPASAQPLARPHRTEPGLIEAWDLIVAGSEIATAFSELVDPVEQRERLQQQSLRAAAGDHEAMQLDEDFLRALEHAAPPMGGLGVGVDRLLMLLRDVGIRETILFPFLRPEASR